jgi:hypothetical protein
MYPYIISAKENRFLLVINSEKNPLKSYIVTITVNNHKIVKYSCECKGYAIRGSCKHIDIAKNRVKTKI